MPLAALPRLRMDVPIGSEGKSEITILLVSVDGAILNEAKSTLVVVPPKQVSALPAGLDAAGIGAAYSARGAAGAARRRDRSLRRRIAIAP